MNKLIILIGLFYFFFNNSYSEEKKFCFENNDYDQFNFIEKLNEIEIEISDKKKWYRNIFSIVRNNGWIKNDIKKNHRAKIILKFENGFLCQDIAKIRFHGDNPDHYKIIDDFHIISSLNIKLLKSNLDNNTEFKLFLPYTRGDENEIFATNFLKELNFFAPKTKKIKVKINGIKSEYLFQEKISKELIEKNGFPEGPIMEGDQRFFHIGMRNLNLGRVINKNWSSRNWRNAHVSLDALSKLNKVYLDFYNNINEFKIHEPYAIYYTDLALNEENIFNKKNNYLNFYDDLISTMNSYDHALVPDNRTFYYNYFENYFYPIYYDGNIGPFRKNISEINLKKLKDNKEIIKKINTIDKKNLDHLNKLSGAKLLNDANVSSFLNLIVYNLKHISSERLFNKEEIKSFKHTKYFSKFQIENIRLIFYKSYPNNFYVCDYDLSNCKDEKFDLEEIGDILSQTYKQNNKYKYIFVTNDFNNYSKTGYIPKKNKIGFI